MRNIRRGVSRLHQRTAVYVPGSFSESSGGRTRATFLRAALLADDFRESWILTFNFRIEYAQIFAGWAERTRCPATVRMLNFYEALAGSSIYAEGGVTKFDVPEKAVEVAPDRWRLVANDRVEFFRLRRDGSLKRRDVERDGTRLVEYFDSRCRLRVREHRVLNGPTEKEYFSDGPQRFASVRAIPDGKVIRVDGGPLATDGKYVNELDLQMQWFRGLVDQADDPVFMVEHRMYDRLLLDNPHLSERPATIAVIHSTHLSAPFDDIHHLRSYNSKSLARMRDFSATVVLTREQARDIKGHFNPVRLHVIPHPVQLPRRSAGEPRRSKRVVVATRLIGLKRVDHMVRAFARVLERHPDAEFHVWGGGEEREKLRQLVRQLGIARSVVLKGHTHDVWNVLQGGVVGLSASEREGIGLSVVESLAAGLPVVSYTYKYGPRDMIRHGANGFLVDVGDVPAMAERVVWLLDHPRRRALMSVRARAARWRFRPQRVRRKWLRLLSTISSPESAPGHHREA